MTDFHTKYRDNNLYILLETYKRISYSTVFYQPAVIGTSIKIETKTDENALKNNGKIMTGFKDCLLYTSDAADE